MFSKPVVVVVDGCVDVAEGLLVAVKPSLVKIVVEAAVVVVVVEVVVVVVLDVYDVAATAAVSGDPVRVFFMLEKTIHICNGNFSYCDNRKFCHLQEFKSMKCL